MANETNSEVNIISEWFIRPNCELEQSKYVYNLSSDDLVHLPTSYMHKGLLYTKPSSLHVFAFVQKFKHSLSLALVNFYPLAGRLQTINYEDEDATSFHVACNVGPGARLIHADAIATHNLRVSDIVTSNTSISRNLIWSFFDAGDTGVVNYDGNTRALVSVQVTELVDGVFIGFTMNHCIGDGTSFWHFTNTLSKIFMDQENIDVNKPTFKAAVEYGDRPVNKVSGFDPGMFIHRVDVDPQLTIRLFNFTVESIAKLKAQARENSHNPISSFQALSAFIWLSISRARKHPLESDMICFIAAGFRSRFDPPLPPNQFGNLAHALRVTSKMDDLMRNGLDWARLLIHKAITGPDYKMMQAKLKDRIESQQVVPLQTIPSLFGSRKASNSPLMFTGSMRFDVYGPEFGLGKPVATRTGYSNWKDGMILVNPGREGGGSAELQVCLLSETMATLVSNEEFVLYILNL